MNYNTIDLPRNSKIEAEQVFLLPIAPQPEPTIRPVKSREFNFWTKSLSPVIGGVVTLFSPLLNSPNIIIYERWGVFWIRYKGTSITSALESAPHSWEIA